MPGPRQRLAVLEGNGRKHLSKSEKAQRAAQEVNLPKPQTMRLPKWLPEEHRKEFRALAKELLATDIGAAQLDRDTLGRYVVAQAQYAQVCKMAGEALAAKNSALAEKWTKIQNTCFKQARACANDMGMTITSRCRLVLPEGAKKKEKNPFEQMMEERMRRA
ncbi:MAG: phage terminase small subunit P27 family [Clostridiales bacterium]|uniref:phage terminase small subunit P27 family n=1 Tax=Flavonifractor porci TaxID=3133422 RepID=UPI003098DCCA|nr:phage terminase small subunit P27 family [Clostridiales bacterium]